MAECEPAGGGVARPLGCPVGSPAEHLPQGCRQELDVSSPPAPRGAWSPSLLEATSHPQMGPKRRSLDREGQCPAPRLQRPYTMLGVSPVAGDSAVGRTQVTLASASPREPWWFPRQVSAVSPETVGPDCPGYMQCTAWQRAVLSLSLRRSPAGTGARPKTLSGPAPLSQT